jgi:outer membrane protein
VANSGKIQRPIGYALAWAVLGAIGWSDAYAQSIADAMAEAYRNNPQLLASRARVRATDEQVPQALAGWRPTVDMTADTGAARYQTNIPSSSSPELQHREPKSTKVEIAQPLYRGGRTMAATSEAENNVKAERARLVTSEQRVLLDAATAYLNLYREIAVLDLNTNNEQVLRRQLDATRDRFQVGEITRTDVFQAEARLARATADRIKAQGDLEIARASYVRVIGAPPPGAPTLPASPDQLPEDKDKAIRDSAVQNPAVVAAEYDQRAAKDRVDGATGELLPTFRIVASAGKDWESSNESSRISNLEAKLKFSMPIYEAGATYAKVRGAKHTAAERQNLIDKERRDAVQTANRAWDTLQSARARVDSFDSQIKAAIVALEGVEREAAVGSRTVLDVLNAEQELLDAKVNHVRAQRDELVAAFELKSAAGLLTAERLGLKVELYDPVVNYDESRGKLFGTSVKGGVE